MTDSDINQVIENITITAFTERTLRRENLGLQDFEMVLLYYKYLLINSRSTVVFVM